MGSAAFLVAACRYLANHLVNAWVREGDDHAKDYRAKSTDQAADAEVDPVVVNARRHIIEHCLYGADINEMAVEVAKLSLWLVSMDPERPFTFLDDRLIVGDSLLRITSLDQLEVMHMDAKHGRQIHERLDVRLTAGVRDLSPASPTSADVLLRWTARRLKAWKRSEWPTVSSDRRETPLAIAAPVPLPGITLTLAECPGRQ